MSSDVAAPPARVLVTKIGLDGHDRGSRIVASYLRDAGMEVVYTPPWQSIEAVVNIAVQEDIELIGVSTLATDHLIVPQLMAALGNAGLGDVGMVVGGIVPANEHGPLLAAGVDKIFGPGTTREEIVACALELATRTRAARGTGL
jgi:methylmalonyl-CoA mutase C-terminal domain/subunit